MVKVFEVVIVLLRHMEKVAMLAARMRAKPHFGLRVLIAVVPATASADERRAAVGSGFDDAVNESRDARQLVARILRRLRVAAGASLLPAGPETAGGVVPIPATRFPRAASVRRGHAHAGRGSR